mmetsp:Transcript_132735/g.424688  ORF Transcript_132735/g.424688 Transcript_132735/m.424688 type:complete len:119 (+) Transcript_132735:109-465(+)
MASLKMSTELRSESYRAPILGYMGHVLEYAGPSGAGATKPNEVSFEVLRARARSFSMPAMPGDPSERQKRQFQAFQDRLPKIRDAAMPGAPAHKDFSSSLHYPVGYMGASRRYKLPGY